MTDFQTQIDQLIAELGQLRLDVGDFTTRADMSKPPKERQNGEYPIAFRQKQLGFAIDSCVEKVRAMGEVVSGFDARLKALEGKTVMPPVTKDTIEPDKSITFTDYEIQKLGDLNFNARARVNHTGPIKERLYALAMALKNQDGLSLDTWTDANRGYLLQLMANEDASYLPLVQRLAQRIGVTLNSDAPASFPSNAQVIEGDVIFKGRVGFGGLNPEANAQIHILGQNDASILFGSNLSGGQWQSAKAHWAMKSLSGDGGFRDMQNVYTTIESRDAYDPDGQVWYKSQLKEFLDDTRPAVKIGPDSRGDFSIFKRLRKDDSHEYTQDVVLKVDEDAKELRWESYRKGWSWAFGVDCKYGPARFWKAIFG